MVGVTFAAAGFAASISNLYKVFKKQLEIISDDDTGNSPAIRAMKDGLKDRINNNLSRYQIKRIDVQDVTRESSGYLSIMALADGDKDKAAVLLKKMGADETQIKKFLSDRTTYREHFEALGITNPQTIEGILTRVDLGDEKIEGYLRSINLSGGEESIKKVLDVIRQKQQPEVNANLNLLDTLDNKTARLFKDAFIDNVFADPSEYLLKRSAFFEAIKDDHSLRAMAERVQLNNLQKSDFDDLQEAIRDIRLLTTSYAKTNLLESFIGVDKILRRVRGEEFDNESVLSEMRGLHAGPAAKDKTFFSSLMPPRDSAFEKEVIEQLKIEMPDVNPKEVMNFFRKMKDAELANFLRDHNSITGKLWGRMVTASYYNGLGGADVPELQAQTGIFKANSDKRLNLELTYMAKSWDDNSRIIPIIHEEPNFSDHGTGFALPTRSCRTIREEISDPLVRTKYKNDYSYTFDFNPDDSDSKPSVKDLMMVLRFSVMRPWMENDNQSREFSGSTGRACNIWEFEYTLGMNDYESLRPLKEGRLVGSSVETKLELGSPDEFVVVNSLVAKKVYLQHTTIEPHTRPMVKILHEFDPAYQRSDKFNRRKAGHNPIQDPNHEFLINDPREIIHLRDVANFIDNNRGGRQQTETLGAMGTILSIPNFINRIQDSPLIEKVKDSGVKISRNLAVGALLAGTALAAPAVAIGLLAHKLIRKNGSGCLEHILAGVVLYGGNQVARSFQEPFEVIGKDDPRFARVHQMSIEEARKYNIDRGNAPSGFSAGYSNSLRLVEGNDTMYVIPTVSNICHILTGENNIFGSSTLGDLTVLPTEGSLVSGYKVGKDRVITEVNLAPGAEISIIQSGNIKKGEELPKPIFLHRADGTSELSSGNNNPSTTAPSSVTPAATSAVDPSKLSRTLVDGAFYVYTDGGNASLISSNARNTFDDATDIQEYSLKPNASVQVGNIIISSGDKEVNFEFSNPVKSEMNLDGNTDRINIGTNQKFKINGKEYNTSDLELLYDISYNVKPESNSRGMLGDLKDFREGNGVISSIPANLIEQIKTNPATLRLNVQALG
ncbi:MAG: hypothetical protein SFT90_03180 [Rickettsiales bacterium]|nr:hypothetical protein [Rickettsiales bacterium]